MNPEQSSLAARNLQIWTRTSEPPENTQRTVHWRCLRSSSEATDDVMSSQGELDAGRIVRELRTERGETLDAVKWTKFHLTGH